MYKVSYLVILFFAFVSSCSNNSEKKSDDEKKEIILFNGDLDSVVHVYHEPDNMLENELVLMEEDSLLQHMLNDEAYNIKTMEKLMYYYNSKVVFKDKNKISDLLNCFPLSDNNQEKTSPKCVAFYRDIYQFYSKGNLMGVMKICFSCGQYSFHINDGAFGQQMLEKELQVQTDFEKLEKLVVGYLN